MNSNFKEMLPSTSRQRVHSSTTTNNNYSNNNNDNNNTNTDNSNNNNNRNHSAIDNNTDTGNNNSDSDNNDEMDTQDFIPTPEVRTREPSIYDYLPQSKNKRKRQYAFWKMLKDEESMQSCLKKFKKCSLENDTSIRHVVLPSKDPSGSRLKRKIPQKKRDNLTTSTGRVSQHRPSENHASSSLTTVCPLMDEGLPELIPPSVSTTENNDSD